MASIEQNCTLLLQSLRLQNDETRLTVDEIKQKLEGRDEDKIIAMRQVIVGMLNGEQMGAVLMHVIRFCITSNNHRLKKLLMLYWECVDKRSPDGKILPEMILVCNALRNDLIHPNEYIRGCTLRLCTKIRESEILQPLIPSITQNLEHRHSFVRRNAILAVFAIFHTFPALIPNAPDLVHQLLQTEADITTKRNAFLMLFNCDQPKAIEYMHSVLDQVHSMGDGFQLVVLELARKLCRSHPHEKSKYIKCIITLMETASDAVLFECASTLVSVSRAPTAVRAAASCYAQLMRTHGDNNVKLVILDRLTELKQMHLKVMQEIVLDLIPSIQSSSPDIQSKAVSLVCALVTDRTVDEVMSALRRELIRPSTTDINTDVAKTSLIHSIQGLARRFPRIAPTAVAAVLDCLPDLSVAAVIPPTTTIPTPASAAAPTVPSTSVSSVSKDSKKGESASEPHPDDEPPSQDTKELKPFTIPGVDAVRFVREMVTKHQALQATAIEKLIGMLDSIQCPRVLRASLWMCGQFCEAKQEIETAFNSVFDCIGTLPLTKQSDAAAAQEKGNTGLPTVLPDGTYMTHTAMTTSSSTSPTVPYLRLNLLRGDLYLGNVLAACLTKLLLRLKSQVSEADHNAWANRCLLAVVSLMSFAKSQDILDRVSRDRYSVCVRAITEPSSDVASVFLAEPLATLNDMLRRDDDSATLLAPEKQADVAATVETVLVDTPIAFRQLRATNKNLSSLEIEDAEFLGTSGVGIESDDFESRLGRTLALTGFGDPIYAEAVVVMHDFDVSLDVTLTNKTNEHMHDLTVEFSTIGDLELCERPQPFGLGAGQTHHLHTSIKVTSTNTSAVFGTITFRTTADQSSTQSVEMNHIVLAVLDYVHPDTCSDTTFRSMWVQFEWENKVIVNTTTTSIPEYMARIAKFTHTRCLTPTWQLVDSNFCSANFFARTKFGEDALMNVSLQLKEKVLEGVVRIRSQSKGVALGLGDKIAASQKEK